MNNVRLILPAREGYNEVVMLPKDNNKPDEADIYLADAGIVFDYENCLITIIGELIHQ